MGAKAGICLGLHEEFYNKVLNRGLRISERKKEKMKTNIPSSWFLLGALILPFVVTLPCMSELSETDREYLSIIAEANRANKELLESFDCQYTFNIVIPEPGQTHITTTSQKLVAKRGRYAFSGDKAYNMDKVLNTEHYMHYVHNGSMKRTRRPGAVVLGSTPDCGLKPGTPDPWSVVDESVSVGLDNLDEKKYGKVVSVESSMLDGRNCQKVIISTPSRLPDGTISSYSVSVWYSEEDGYMPVKYRLERHEKPEWGGSIIGDGEVREIRKYNVDGNILYLPVDFHEEVYHDGSLSSTGQYNVDTNSVRINPELPDELFQIKIRPDDQVIDKDLGLELRGPGGMNFLEELNILEDLEERDAPKLTKPATRTIDLCDNVQLKFVRIPQGAFIMGCPETEVGYPPWLVKRLVKQGKPTRPNAEGPPHSVTMPKEFYMAKYEVTCAQYRCFRPNYQRMPHERRRIDLDNQPVLVSWNDAVAFCNWLSVKTGLSVRLPKETEWEYACRAGTNTRFFWGDKEEDAGQYANIADKTYKKVWPDRAYCFDTNDGESLLCSVGKYKPNKFGLFDMLGNATEWCQDTYMEHAYKLDSQNSEGGESLRNKRVYRGGGWVGDVISARCASRGYGAGPDDERLFIGFRPVIEEN